jgi:hypothetical protein
MRWHQRRRDAKLADRLRENGLQEGRDFLLENGELRMRYDLIAAYAERATQRGELEPEKLLAAKRAMGLLD